MWLRVRILNSLVFQFKDYRACYPRFLARSGPQLFCEGVDLQFSFCQLPTRLKGVLDQTLIARAFARQLRCHRHLGQARVGADNASEVVPRMATRFKTFSYSACSPEVKV